MNPVELRTRIIEIFERNRQVPGSYYDEINFLDYLITPPALKSNIKNSFKGVRRYYRFFEEVELTFGICFSLSDQDRYYTLDQFVKKTEERLYKTRSNKQIIRRRLQEKGHYFVELILTLILAIVMAILKVHLISVAITIGYGVAIWWIIGSKLRDKRHNKLLFEKIKKG